MYQMNTMLLFVSIITTIIVMCTNPVNQEQIPVAKQPEILNSIHIDGMHSYGECYTSDGEIVQAYYNSNLWLRTYDGGSVTKTLPAFFSDIVEYDGRKGEKILGVDSDGKRTVIAATYYGTKRTNRRTFVHRKVSTPGWISSYMKYENIVKVSRAPNGEIYAATGPKSGQYGKYALWKLLSDRDQSHEKDPAQKLADLPDWVNNIQNLVIADNGEILLLTYRYNGSGYISHPVVLSYSTFNGVFVEVNGDPTKTAPWKNGGAISLAQGPVLSYASSLTADAPQTEFLVTGYDTPWAKLKTIPVAALESDLITLPQNTDGDTPLLFFLLGHNRPSVPGSENDVEVYYLSSGNHFKQVDWIKMSNLPDMITGLFDIRVTPDAKVFVLYRHFDDKEVHLHSSIDNGKTWIDHGAVPGSGDSGDVSGFYLTLRPTDHIPVLMHGFNNESPFAGGRQLLVWDGNSWVKSDLKMDNTQVPDRLGREFTGNNNGFFGYDIDGDPFFTPLGSKDGYAQYFNYKKTTSGEREEWIDSRISFRQDIVVGGSALVCDSFMMTIHGGKELEAWRSGDGLIWEDAGIFGTSPVYIDQGIFLAHGAGKIYCSYGYRNGSETNFTIQTFRYDGGTKWSPAAEDIKVNCLGYLRGLKVGPDGLPVILYDSVYGGINLCAKLYGSRWQTIGVTNAIQEFESFHDISLALGSDGSPLVVMGIYVPNGTADIYTLIASWCPVTRIIQGKMPDWNNFEKTTTPAFTGNYSAPGYDCSIAYFNKSGRPCAMTTKWRWNGDPNVSNLNEFIPVIF